MEILAAIALLVMLQLLHLAISLPPADDKQRGGVPRKAQLAAERQAS